MLLAWHVLLLLTQQLPYTIHTLVCLTQTLMQTILLLPL
jgi:hypothetical protein